MNEYLISQQQTNELLIKKQLHTDEIKRFSISDERWAKHVTNRNQSSKRTIKKGEIYQFEFGKNYCPEMSYEHRGLIIGVKNQMLYVLPIFSYDAGKHKKDCYDPVSNPTGIYYLLEKSSFNFLSHDSVLKLSDIRSVSKKRILYQQTDSSTTPHQFAKIDPSSDTYKTITNLVFQKYFYEYYNELEESKKQIELLKQELNKLKNQNQEPKE